MSQQAASATFLKACSSFEPAALERIKDALAWAIELHHDQIRQSGDPYVIHPITVATYLARLEADSETIIAALLHDTVEDSNVELSAIEVRFGDTVALLVDGVTKLSAFHYEGTRSDRQVASLRKLLLIASEDLRVIFIKLADRWHNVETIHSLPPDKQRRIAHETLEIYVPFARIVGLWELKALFENICFPLAYPEVYEQWHQAILSEREVLQEERLSFVHRIDMETGSHVTASLQYMTDYQLYTKLQGNLERLQRTNNFDSILLLVESVHNDPLECYRVLGQVHKSYAVHIGLFRDYISTPQPNGYSALHTTIFLSPNHEIRLRIQTRDMYEYATHRKLSVWMELGHNDVTRALSSLQSGSFSKEGYMKDLHENMLKKRINVFTIAGEVLPLPADATGVDFAFTINPDHLAYLAGVRVNGELYEATHQLHEGDIVELVLLSNGNNDKHAMWLDKVKSVQAREELKRTLANVPRSQQQETGEKMLELECKKRRLPLWWLSHLSGIQTQLSSRLTISSFDVLLENIGTGQISVADVADAYASIILQPPGWTIRLLKFFGLLPRSRVLNQGASVIDIEITAEDRRGLIYDISRCFAERDINIARFEVYAVPPKDALYRIRLEAPSFEAFSDLFDTLLQIPSVKEVIRKS